MGRFPGFGRLLMVLLVGLGIARGVGAAGSSEAAAELVARSIRHHGGTLYTSSRFELQLCSKSGCSQLRLVEDGGLYEHCVTAPREGGERKVCADNDRVREWSRAPAGAGPWVLQPEPGSERAQSLRDWAMARVYFAFLPYRLEDPSVRLEDLGSERWEDRSLRKVKVTFEAGSSSDADDEFLYWFDPVTARLELFAYSYQRDQGGVRFRRLFNFRRVGGILFFDQENLGLDGPGLSVDLVSPSTVDSMRRVSTVELRDIKVHELR